jgi:flagellar protein FliO/FliZ
MRLKITLCGLLFWGNPVLAADAPQAARTVASGDIANWSLGLLIVLGVFFLCAWAMRKLAGVNVGGSSKMRVLGGVSLGMREKVVLLQVGNKQLILGVTPGRIQTLHVLEGDDCLGSENDSLMETGFARKLKQAMKGQPDA